jgi:tetratricopeptide (TPR) repeat protein
MAAAKPPASSRVFISYRREDSGGHVLALLPALRERFGIFKDTDNIPPGEDFVKVIRRELDSCSVLLAVIGKEWLTIQDPRLKTRRLDNPDDFLRLEVATALKNENIRVIPVLVGRASMPSAEDLPTDLAELSHRNALELSDTRWEVDVRRLIEAIQRASETTAPVANIPHEEPTTDQIPGLWSVEDLQARRKREIAKHLASARQALEAKDYDTAAEECEKAAVLDPGEPEALKLLRDARTAMAKQDIDALLAEARRLLTQGDLSGASELIDQALLRHSKSQPALALREELLKVRADQARTRERARSIRAAIDRAQSSIDEEEFEAAIRHADTALALDADSADAQAIRATAVAALEERRRQRDLKRRAMQIASEARAEFAAGQHAQALARLRDFSPPHELVTRALEELQPQADAIARVRQRVASLIADARNEMAAGRFQDAIARLQEARQLAPEDEDISGLLAKAEAREAVRVAAERVRREAEAHIASASARFQQGDYPGARERLHAAASVDPEHPAIAEWLQRIEKAVGDQAIAQNRERAARAELDAGHASFQAGDFEAALRRAEHALMLSPSLDEAKALKERTTAALAERRAHEEHERRAHETVADARRLMADGKHQAALDLLTAFEPPHTLVAGALNDVRNELQAIERQRRAEQQKKAEREAAERQVAERAAADRARAEAQERAAQQIVVDARAEFAAGAHEDAIERLRQFAPPHPVVVRALQDLEARWTILERERHEREEAERQRRRGIDRQVADLLSDARTAVAAERFADASAALKKAGRLDPDGAEVRAVQREVDAAAKAAKIRIEAEEKKRKQINAEAKSRIEAHLTAGRLDEAETLLNAAPSPLLESAALDLRRQLGDLRRRAQDASEREARVTQLLTEAQAAFTAGDFKSARSKALQAEHLAPDNEMARSLLESAKSELKASTPPFWSTARVIQVAAAATVVLTVATWMTFGPSRDASPPEPVQQQQPPPTATPTQPQTSPKNPAAPPQASPTTPPTTLVAEAAKPVSVAPPAPLTSGAVAAEKPASKPAGPDPRAARLESLRVSAREHLQQGRRPQALADILSGLGIDASDSVLQGMLDTLLREAQASMERARREASDASAATLARTAFEEAQATERTATSLGQSGRKGEAVGSLWAAREQYEKASELARSQAQEIAQRQRADELARQKQAALDKAKSEQKPENTPAPAAVIVPPKSPVKPTPPPPAEKPVDESERVRDTLKRYEAAYESLNAAAVKAVFPSARLESLARTFRDVNRYDLDIQVQKISFSGPTSATAVCRVTHDFDAKAGSQPARTMLQTFALEKQGSSWIITSIR